MDIIRENELLRHNYDLRKQNDEYSAKIEKQNRILGSRHQILSEIVNKAVEIIRSWEMRQMDKREPDEFFRGELVALESMFERMQLLGKNDEDLINIIKEPVNRLNEYRRWLIAVREEEIQKVRKKK